VELRGPTFEAGKITPKSTIIGEGNYGEVFQVHHTTLSLGTLLLASRADHCTPTSVRGCAAMTCECYAVDAVSTQVGVHRRLTGMAYDGCGY